VPVLCLTTVGLFEVKNRLSELVARAARGEEIVITRRGVPVACLMSSRAPDAPGQAHALASRICCSRLVEVPRRTPGQLPSNGASIRDMIEAGRR